MDVCCAVMNCIYAPHRLKATVWWMGVVGRLMFVVVGHLHLQENTKSKAFLKYAKRQLHAFFTVILNVNLSLARAPWRDATRDACLEYPNAVSDKVNLKEPCEKLNR